MTGIETYEEQSIAHSFDQFMQGLVQQAQLASLYEDALVRGEGPLGPVLGRARKEALEAAAALLNADLFSEQGLALARGHQNAARRYLDMIQWLTAANAEAHAAFNDLQQEKYLQELDNWGESQANAIYGDHFDAGSEPDVSA